MIASLVGRAFASASIQGAPDHVIDSVTPALLNLSGRALIRRGEILLARETGTGSPLYNACLVGRRDPAEKPVRSRSKSMSARSPSAILSKARAHQAPCHTRMIRRKRRWLCCHNIRIGSRTCCRAVSFELKARFKGRACLSPSTRSHRTARFPLADRTGPRRRRDRLPC